MLNWFKRKKRPAENVALPQTPISRREDVVAEALKNMQEIRDKIGEEKLQKLAQMILHKKTETDDTSPSLQAKKIMAHMDKEKLGQFIKLMVQDDQTKH